MLAQYYPTVSHRARFELHKDMNFAAAHLIPTPLAGNCANMHGHTYFCDLMIIGDELNDAGFLVNFKDLKKMVHGRYDHSVMNNHPEYTIRSGMHPDMFPSTEVVARNIWGMVQQYLDAQPNHAFCAQVILRETPTSYVVYKAPLPDEWRPDRIEFMQSFQSANTRGNLNSNE